MEMTEDKAQCRLCLRYLPNAKLQPLFVKDDPEQLLLKCMTICPFIKNHAGFPDKICNSCEDYVIFFQLFQQRCFENEILIRKNMHGHPSVYKQIPEPEFDFFMEALEDEQEIPMPGTSKVDPKTTNIPLLDTTAIENFDETLNELSIEASGNHLIQDDTMLSRIENESNEEIVQVGNDVILNDASGFDVFPPSNDILPEICGFEEVNFLTGELLNGENIPEPINEDVILESANYQAEQGMTFNDERKIDISGFNLREFFISIEKLDINKLMKEPSELIGYENVNLGKFYDLKLKNPAKKPPKKTEKTNTKRKPPATKKTKIKDAPKKNENLKTFNQKAKKSTGNVKKTDILDETLPLSQLFTASKTKDKSINDKSSVSKANILVIKTNKKETGRQRNSRAKFVAQNLNENGEADELIEENVKILSVAQNGTVNGPIVEMNQCNEQTLDDFTPVSPVETMYQKRQRTQSISQVLAGVRKREKSTTGSKNLSENLDEVMSPKKKMKLIANQQNESSSSADTSQPHVQTSIVSGQITPETTESDDENVLNQNLRSRSKSVHFESPVQNKTDQKNMNNNNIKSGIFKCKFLDCTKVYRKVSYLLEHINVDHKNWFYSCPECAKQFRRKRTAREHMSTEHNISHGMPIENRGPNEV